MNITESLERGRDAYRRRHWIDAYKLFAESNRSDSLAAEDLERFAIAAYLMGNDSECTEAWERAHHGFDSREDRKSAARCAFWLGMILADKGELARSNGWIARARRLVEESGDECVERGFLLVPLGLQQLEQGKPAEAHAAFQQAERIADRFADRDLRTLAVLGRGQALIEQNDVASGVPLLDEAMVAAESDEISPIIVGIAYCAVIESCLNIFDFRRAREWTAMLSRWCNTQPGLVPFRGQCQVRRADIMQLHGDWTDALSAAERACELLSQPPGEPAAGVAFYCRAELHRLRGELSEAEEAYRQASRWGHKPQPGLALLRLAQGHIDAAKAAILRVDAEERTRLARSRILPATVEILLAAEEKEWAWAAASELAEIAEELGAPFLQGLAGRATGSVLLADGEPQAALEKLRTAWTLLNECHAAYETARVRELIGHACRALGDDDTAQLELDAARWLFRRLGASRELDRLEITGTVQSGGAEPQTNIAPSAQGESPPNRGREAQLQELTLRELQVLRLIATGKTNKLIAAELFLSERTVDRHVSNIFTKLDVPSRTAATAYAYEHDLI